MNAYLGQGERIDLLGNRVDLSNQFRQSLLNRSTDQVWRDALARMGISPEGLLQYARSLAGQSGSPSVSAPPSPAPAPTRSSVPPSTPSPAQPTSTPSSSNQQGMFGLDQKTMMLLLMMMMMMNSNRSSGSADSRIYLPPVLY